jgi:hypothetical protein
MKMKREEVGARGCSPIAPRKPCWWHFYSLLVYHRSCGKESVRTLSELFNSSEKGGYHGHKESGHFADMAACSDEKRFNSD